MAPHGLSIDVADLMTRLSAPGAVAGDRCVCALWSAGMPDDSASVEYRRVRLADPDDDDELDDDDLEDEEDDENEEEEEESDDEEDDGGWEDEEDEDDYDDEDEEDEDEPLQASR